MFTCNEQSDSTSTGAVLSGGTPVAVVSMDNCSHNGEKLKTSVLTVVEEWEKRGFVTKEFADWVNNEEKCHFHGQ